MCTTVKQQRTECLTSLKIDALMEQAARPPHVRLPEVHNMTQSKYFQIIKLKFALNANTLTQLWNQQFVYAQQEEVVLSKTKL